MKIFKQLVYITTFLLTILLFSTECNYDNAAAFDTIATFLSITIGFTMTALSIIATSSFSNELYKIEDEQDNSRTLLHVLINQFKTSAFIFISTIGLILFYKFFSKSQTVEATFFIKSQPITFFIILKSCIWCLTIVSFYFFVNLFETFSRFVIKTAEKQ